MLELVRGCASPGYKRDRIEAEKKGIEKNAGRIYRPHPSSCFRRVYRCPFYSRPPPSIIDFGTSSSSDIRTGKKKTSVDQRNIVFFFIVFRTRICPLWICIWKCLVQQQTNHVNESMYINNLSFEIWIRYFLNTCSFIFVVTIWEKTNLLYKRVNLRKKVNAIP